MFRKRKLGFFQQAILASAMFVYLVRKLAALLKAAVIYLSTLGVVSLRPGQGYRCTCRVLIDTINSQTIPRHRLTRADLRRKRSLPFNSADVVSDPRVSTKRSAALDCVLLLSGQLVSRRRWHHSSLHHRLYSHHQHILNQTWGDLA